MAGHGSPIGHKKLSLCHRIAVNAYMSGMTKGEALLEAGYSKKSGVSVVFDRPDVCHEIERLTERVMAKYEVDREWVTEQLVDIATAGVTLAKFKKITEDGKLNWDFSGATEAELALIDSLTVENYPVNQGGGFKSMKITIPSRQSALDSLCRIHGLNKDKLDVTGELSLVERLQRGRERARLEGGVVEVLEVLDGSI